MDNEEGQLNDMDIGPYCIHPKSSQSNDDIYNCKNRILIQKFTQPNIESTTREFTAKNEINVKTINNGSVIRETR